MPDERQCYINSINLNAQSDFPYLVLDVAAGRAYPRNPGFQVMHWHEDLQFIYVLAGAVQVRTLDTALALSAGEGCFINRDVVHHVGHSMDGHYKSFIFPAYFLAFYPGSPARELVSRIVGQPQLPLLPLRPGGQDAALAVLARLAALEANRGPLYPYQVLSALSALYLALLQGAPAKASQPSPVRERMQAFLRYISAHFGEEITLEELSRSANVSKSECLRCFRLSMGTTPYRYLLEYRLSRAEALLRQSDLPIGEIASRVGFHQVSHFGKCFRQRTGCSPREYRRRRRGAL